MVDVNRALFYDVSFRRQRIMKGFLSFFFAFWDAFRKRIGYNDKNDTILFLMLMFCF